MDLPHQTWRRFVWTTRTSIGEFARFFWGPQMSAVRLGKCLFRFLCISSNILFRSQRQINLILHEVYQLVSLISWTSKAVRAMQFGSLQAGRAAILLIISLLACLLIGTANGQQNGEVTALNHGQRGGQQQPAWPPTVEDPDRQVKTTLMNKQLQYLDANGQPVLVQFTYVGPPKILPIATADSYPEGSTINLICTVSGGQRKGLTLGWTKDGQDLSDGDSSLRFLELSDNVSIEKTGADISILRIANASHANSGRFTCMAKNPLGEDSTSVNIVINVELKWNKLPVDTEIGLNQDLSIECDAIGQPQPQLTWTKHPSALLTGTNGTTNKPMVVSQGKVLKLTKAQHKDSGLYECVARNGVDQDLRRIIQVKVRGKYSNLSLKDVYR